MTSAFFAAQHTVAAALTAIPTGVWLVDKAAVEIFDCDGLVCGRIVWLKSPRDPTGQMNHDVNNPDPALRKRPLCGLTIFWNLRPSEPEHWEGGGLYNPEDGKTYSISAHLESTDVISARIYVGIPLFGTTKTLVRVPPGTSDGWC